LIKIVGFFVSRSNLVYNEAKECEETTMSLSKYSLSTILTYGIVFFLPIAFIPSGHQVAATTIGYLVGAAIMFFLYFKQTEPLSFEHKRSKISSILIYGLTGIIAAILLQNLAIFIESLFGEVSASQNTENIIAIVLQNPLFALGQWLVDQLWKNLSSAEP